MFQLIAALRELAERESMRASAFRVAGRYELAARHEARRGAFLEVILLARRYATIEAPEDE